MQDNIDTKAQKYVLAIDAGTSGTKVGLVNRDGEVVEKASGRYETRFLPNGGAEQVPAEWWQVITNGVKQVIKTREWRQKKSLPLGLPANGQSRFRWMSRVNR